MAIAKKQIASVLQNRFGDVFERLQKRPAETLPTGIAELDASLNGFPRGGITEIHGAISSGRTSLLLSALAVATKQEETCALVDCSDTFDPSSAVTARVDFDRLLWVRCGNSLERAFKATDLLLQSGGFGVVVLNLGDIAGKSARQIISSWWFRFRRAIEATPTALVVITPMACIRSCAALVLEVENEGAVWPNTLSLVLENSNGKLTISEDTKRLTHQLSLVTYSVRPPGNNSLHLTHSHLFQGICVRVSRERPLAWTGGPTRFHTRLH